jgi:hypothetical protein
MPGEFPPAPPQSPRQVDDERKEAARQWVARMKAQLDGTGDNEEDT